MSGHVSVMGDEAVAALRVRSGRSYVDATFGAGGYTRRILEAGGRVYAFDRDPSAVRGGQGLVAEAGDMLELIEAPFDGMEAALAARGAPPVDGVVFDLGVSSMQLDEGGRGFSFMRDGPLDMRMGTGRSAAEFVAQAEEAEIADVLYQYGEERQSRRLARAIVQDRRRSPFETTGALAGLAERVLGTKEKIHPATRTFQALRILVNDELGQLVRGLMAAERVLRAGGRLVAVSFHSLEDRIVKRFLAAASGASAAVSRHAPKTDGPAPSFGLIKSESGGVGGEEAARNRRARSARMRVAERTDAPTRSWTDEALSGLGAPPLVFSPLQRAWSS
jgi:16S rRNA (cytosine1402-N4)-methyltransferase